MKNKTLKHSMILGAIFAAASLPAQTAGGAGAGPDAQQKIVRVSSLNSIQANQEFQRNVQLLQLQRQRVIELKTQIDNSSDAAEKKTIQANLDDMLNKLNENNQVMFKTYGFSLTRNYTMVVEKSHVYMFVSDEEAVKFEESQKAAE